MSKVQSLAKDALSEGKKLSPARKESPLSGMKGVAAGTAVAALPIVVEKAASFVGRKGSGQASGLADKASEKVKETVSEKADEVTPSMPSGISKVFGNGKKLLGGDQNGSGDGRAAPGHGSGRRMPIQQSTDVAVPVSVAYNAWTQFEDWPEFMHRLESAEQTDDTTVAFSAKIWGINRRFEAEIVEQRPDERIEWNVKEGLAHTGVASFHPLSDRLTRIEVSVDVEPSGMIEKLARGMRFIKRAVRGDLHRFKAHVELEEEAEGAWRGTIKDGKVRRRSDRGSSKSSRSRSNGGNRSSSRAHSNSSGSRRKAGSRS
jgi:uncharacterized membrane protein